MGGGLVSVGPIGEAGRAICNGLGVGKDPTGTSVGLTPTALFVDPHADKNTNPIKNSNIFGYLESFFKLIQSNQARISA